MVQAFFYSEGMQPEDQKFFISSIKTEQRYGQRLKHIIEILSNRDGELEAFMR